jgi:hypothetical protein
MIREAQTLAHDPQLAPGPASGPAITTPKCPKFSAAMVKRRNRVTGDKFWCCPKYPACRGTRPAQLPPSPFPALPLAAAAEPAEAGNGFTGVASLGRQRIRPLWNSS